MKELHGSLLLLRNTFWTTHFAKSTLQPVTQESRFWSRFQHEQAQCNQKRLRYSPSPPLLSIFDHPILQKSSQDLFLTSWLLKSLGFYCLYQGKVNFFPRVCFDNSNKEKKKKKEKRKTATTTKQQQQKLNRGQPTFFNGQPDAKRPGDFHFRFFPARSRMSAVSLWSRSNFQRRGAVWNDESHSFLGFLGFIVKHFFFLNLLCVFFFWLKQVVHCEFC